MRRLNSCFSESHLTVAIQAGDKEAAARPASREIELVGHVIQQFREHRSAALLIF
jgi:hypothetical protein